MTDEVQATAEPMGHIHHRLTDPETPVVIDNGGFLGLSGSVGQIAKGGLAVLFAVLVYQGSQRMFTNDEYWRQQMVAEMKSVHANAARRWDIVGDLKEVLINIRHDLRDLAGEQIKQGRAATRASEEATAATIMAAKKLEAATKEVREKQ